MAPFPLNLYSMVGAVGAALVFLVIGILFGASLEVAGFGNSNKLANQFYLKDMTVLKVMFTAIIVAMVLILGSSAIGLLDLNLIWINPTYLLPGVIGGLIMGVGFVIGGFCPGTSLVAVSTWKVDGVFYVLGTMFGILLFGETVDRFSVFWNSGYLGRVTLPDWLGVDAGVVAVGVVLMALGMFVGAEQLERVFGGKTPGRAPKRLFAGAGILVLAALGVAFVGQPTTEDRWQRVAPSKQAVIDERQVQIHPGELLALMHDHALKLVLVDVRPEADFNLFHIAEAVNVQSEDLAGAAREWQLEPANTVFVVMSNGEAAATEAWKVLVAESVANVYVLEGGVNGWLDVFARDDPRITPLATGGTDALRYAFQAALGAAYPAAEPDPASFELKFTPKVELELKRGPVGGGCG
jgi:rhodanese-related sulfurtransferase